jgi:hypothetical protein
MGDFQCIQSGDNGLYERRDLPFEFGCGYLDVGLMKIVNRFKAGRLGLRARSDFDRFAVAAKKDIGPSANRRPAPSSLSPAPNAIATNSHPAKERNRKHSLE